MAAPLTWLDQRTGTLVRRWLVDEVAPAALFARWADVPGQVHWVKGRVEAGWDTEPAGPRAGARWTTVTRVAGRRMTAHMLAQRWRPPNLAEVAGSWPAGVRSIERLELEQRPGGTLVDLTVGLALPLRPLDRLAWPLVSAYLGWAFEASFRMLARRAGGQLQRVPDPGPDVGTWGLRPPID